MYSDLPEGFEVPIFHVTLRPRLVLGAPRLFSIPNIMAIPIAFVWHAWPVIPLALILQVFAAWGTRQDPDWFSIVLRCWAFKKYYEV